MNDAYVIGSNLRLILTLLLLWFLLFRAVRNYRVEALRERLFSLREELFDYAAKGAVPFDHPAYGRLRQLINGMIRFAHRLTFTRSLLGMFAFHYMGREMRPPAFEQWHRAVAEFPTDIQRNILAIHDRAIAITIRHMAIGSPLLFVLVCFFVVLAYFKGTAKHGQQLSSDLPGVEMWEAQLIEEDHQDRRDQREEAFA